MFICKEEWDKSDAKKEAIVDYLEFYFSDDMCQFYYDAKATQPAKIMEYKDDNAVPLAIDMKQYYEDRTQYHQNRPRFICSQSPTIQYGLNIRAT